MWKVTCLWKSGMETVKYFMEENNALIARTELSRSRGIREIRVFRVDNNEE